MWSRGGGGGVWEGRALGEIEEIESPPPSQLVFLCNQRCLPPPGPTGVTLEEDPGFTRVRCSIRRRLSCYSSYMRSTGAGVHQ